MRCDSHASMGTVWLTWKPLDGGSDRGTAALCRNGGPDDDERRRLPHGMRRIQPLESTLIGCAEFDAFAADASAADASAAEASAAVAFPSPVAARARGRVGAPRRAATDGSVAGAASGVGWAAFCLIVFRGVVIGQRAGGGPSV